MTLQAYQAERFTQALLQHAPDVITILDHDATMIYQSPAIQRVLGYAVDELIGLNAMDYVHADDHPAVREHFGRVVQRCDDGLPITFRLRHKDGGWRWVEVMHNNQLDDPAVGGIVVNFRDVTDRFEIAEQLRAVNALLESLINSSPLGIAACDTQGTFQVWNRAAERIWERKAEEVLSRRADDLGEAGLAMLLDVYGKIADGDHARFETTSARADGALRDVNVVAGAMRTTDGSLHGLVAFFEDVTERNALVRVKQHQQETELTVSRLERQLAESRVQLLQAQLRPHFLFNTLNSIAALMHRDAPAADRMLLNLGSLLRAIIRRSTQQLITISEELEFLHAYLEIEHVRFGERLRVVIQADPATLPVPVPQLLLQPLVENAIRHGTSSRSEPVTITIEVTLVSPTRVGITITDDGCGLPAGWSENRVGLGISVSRRRLEQLYGSEHVFEISRVATGGVRVRILIPIRRAR